MEYHVLIIPLFPWEVFKLQTLDDLKRLIKIADRLFSFNPEIMRKKDPVKQNEHPTFALPEKALLFKLRPYMIRDERSKQ